MRRTIVKFLMSLVGPIALIVLLASPFGMLGGGLGILQPIGGIFDVGLNVNEPVEQTIRLHGLDAEVTVLVDRYGIPHIYATSAKDAFMALGYMHAKDRLAQMIMQNYLAAGRLCELTGGSEAFVLSDMFYRTIGLARSAQRTLEWYEANSDTDPRVAYVLEVIDAEVAGVNAFIDQMTAAQLPLEFKMLGFWPEHWTRHDVFLWAKMMTWSLSGGTYDLLRYWIRTTINNDTMYNELFPDSMPYMVPIIPEQTNLSLSEYPDAPGGYPAALSLERVVPPRHTADSLSALIPTDKVRHLITIINDVMAPLEELRAIGSNNWAVHGSRSSTGRPILANDPHLRLQAPSLWYEAHIVVSGEGDDDLQVSGVTLPGLPGVLIGHNEHTAWGLTNVGADVLDIFIEQVNPANDSEYLYNGEYRPFKIIEEPIRTRDGAVIPFSVKTSVHGPLVDSVLVTYGAPQNLAMNWTGNDVTHEILALSMINRMQSLQDYFDAVYWWDSPPQNIIYADDSGNIALTVAGRFPIRAGYSGELPVVATNDSVGMVSNIPYAFLPRSVNPSQGYLQSANQEPVDWDDYHFPLLGPFDDGYRGRRIDYLLANDDNITVDDMKRFQADALEVRAQEIIPFVIAAWDAEGDGNATVEQAVDWLRDWDYVMNTDIEAPTFWMYLRDAIHYEVFDELLTIDSSLILSRTPILEKLLKENNTYYFDDHRTTTVVETRDQILVRALHTALKNAVAGTGTDDMSSWTYGRYHRVYLYHLMFGQAVYIGGGPHRGQNTLNVAGGWTVRHGPSWRIVADLSNLNLCYGVYPGGQSGNIFSPHWDDLFELWYEYDNSTGQYGYHMMYFYSTVSEFLAADIDHTMIERTITFIP